MDALFTFKGRIGRLFYFTMSILSTISLLVNIFFLLVLLGLIGETLSLDNSNNKEILGFLIVIFIIAFTVLAINQLSLSTRRLHDMGASGWWSILNYTPVINIIFTVVISIIPGNLERNTYGEPPKNEFTKHKNLFIVLIITFIVEITIVFLFAKLNNTENKYTQPTTYYQTHPSTGKLPQSIVSEPNIVSKSKVSGYPCINKVIFSHNGLSKCQNSDKLWGFINTLGEWHIAPYFINSGNFYQNLAAVQDPQNHLWGYINSSNQYVINPQFSCVYYFTERLASVLLGGNSSDCKGGKWGYVNQQNQWQINPIFDSAKQFSNGRAEVIFQGRKGYIDYYGNWIE